MERLVYQEVAFSTEHLVTFRTFVNPESVLLQQLVTAVTLTLVFSSFTGGNVYEGSHGEEMMVTPGEVRGAHQGEAAAPTLHWELAVLGRALRTDVARVGDSPLTLGPGGLQVTQTQPQATALSPPRVGREAHPDEAGLCADRGCGRVEVVREAVSQVEIVQDNVVQAGGERGQLLVNSHLG